MQSLVASDPWLWGVMVLAVIVAMIWIRKDQKRQIRRALQSTETSLKEHSRREAEVLTRSARMLTREETDRLRVEIENAIGAESEEIRQREKRLEERESLLDQQLQSLLENEKQLQQKQKVAAPLLGQVADFSVGSTHWLALATGVAVVADYPVVVVTVLPEQRAAFVHTPLQRPSQ